jgi:hypothetical protein
MTPIQGYTAPVEAAKQALEAAQTALLRDVGQAVGNAGWAFPRNHFDVKALIDHVTSEAQDADFVSKLYAAGPTRPGSRCAVGRASLPIGFRSMRQLSRTRGRKEIEGPKRWLTTSSETD